VAAGAGYFRVICTKSVSLHGVLQSELVASPRDRDASCWRLGTARPPRIGFRVNWVVGGRYGSEEKVSICSAQKNDREGEVPPGDGPC
jgi:hypothetical protein